MNMYNIRFLSFLGIFLILGLLFPFESKAQFKDLLNKAKATISGDDSEVGSGLKQALEFGVDEAVQKLSADKCYLESPYKILVPEEAKYIISKVKMHPGF